MADVIGERGRGGVGGDRPAAAFDVEGPAAGQGMTRVRWMVIFLCFLATTINYIDRTNLGVATPFITKEFHISHSFQGAIFAAFFVTYAVFQLPAGWFIDRVGPRVGYTFACLWWSVVTILTGAVNGLATLLGARLLLGAGEAPAYPSNAKVVSEWFPIRERGIATAIFDIGSKTGTAFALPLVTYVIANYGWRASFVVTGVLGLAWTAWWVLYYRDFRTNRRVSASERAYIEQGGAREEEQAPEAATSTIAPGAPSPRVSWGALWGYRTVWGMMLGFFCLNFVIYFYITWFPSYLVTARHFSLLKLGLFGAIPPLAGVVGELFGGFVSDRLVRRGVSLTVARKVPIVIGMALASVIALAVFVPTAAEALALLSLCYAALVFAAPSIWSLPADIAPTPGHVASIGGIQNFASNLAGIVSPFFVGVMLDLTHTYVVPLVTAGAFAILGALSYLFIVGRVEPLKVR